MATYRDKEKKKEKRNQIIIAVVLSFLMIGSMLGIMLNQDEQTFKYKDYKFRLTQQGYNAKINGKQFSFNYLPGDIEEFVITTDYCNNLRSAAQINVLFEPETQSTQLIDLIRLDMEENYNAVITSSVTNKSDNYPAYEVMSCENATSLSPVIFFKEEENVSLEVQDNCLIAEATGNNFLIFRDRILYCYTGVI